MTIEQTGDAKRSTFSGQLKSKAEKYTVEGMIEKGQVKLKY
jgi:hypothetical protein